MLTIRNQASEISSLNKEVKSLRAMNEESLPVTEVVPVEAADVEAPKKRGRKPAAKKEDAPKTTKKKAAKKEK